MTQQIDRANQKAKAGKSCRLRAAVISDVHLGHRRNKASAIIKNLEKAFPDNHETAELDIIYFAGDVFDDLLSLNDDQLTDIELWVAKFLRLCKKHDVSIRVLEGTPGHDWKQSNMFLTLNEVGQIGADIKHVKDLDILYEERLGIRVLFVPDEWERTTEKTLAQVKDLLIARGIEQVDYAIMHGQFEYQLPEKVKAPKHSSSEYMNLVSKLIFIGHVHTHSVFERIYAQGSFDRLTHGEEGPKGHIRFTAYDDGTHDVEFIENTGAMKFVTINCVDCQLDETFERVSRIVSRLPEGSYVRIEAEPTNPILTSMEELIRIYPTMFWSKKSADATTLEEVKNQVIDEVYVPITITKDNIAEMLMSRVTSKVKESKLVLTCESILKEVI